MTSHPAPLHFSLSGNRPHALPPSFPLPRTQCIPGTSSTTTNCRRRATRTNRTETRIRMQAVGRADSNDNGPHPQFNPAYFVGPLLVANALSWALWGVLSAQLALFVRDARTRRKSAAVLEHGMSERTFGFRRKEASANTSTSADDDVNPWRKSFAAPLAVPSISAYPSQHQHARQRSSKSVPSSFDPYSPTAGHASPLDADSHSMLLPAPANADPLSLYLRLVLYALYVLVCVRTALGTAQFWRVVVDDWGTHSSDLGPRWVGIVLADCIGPIVFIITVAYFIYALYFSPSSSLKTRTSGPALRPLSLKSKANILPEPYSFPFPQSPSSPSQSPWRRVGLRPTLAEPALLALAAIVVSVCGLVDCARESPPGAPLKLDAVALIWFAGMLALDLLLCVLLCRALGPKLVRGSWLVRAVRVMGEAGGTQLVVVFLALVLIVSWRGGKPPSTLTMVAPALLPALYANTVLLHASSPHAREPLPLRVPPKAVGSKFEDIEMGMRPSIGRVVDLAGAAAAGSTYSTTADSGDGGAALRAQALAFGAQRDREREAARMHMERDTLGEGSTGNLPNGNANANEAAKAKALSVRSGVSGALSLELPTFRRGRARYRFGYPMDEESGSELGSEGEWEDEMELDSEEGCGGTWDYGFANAEREKERAAAATMLAGANTNLNGEGGTRVSVQGAGAGAEAGAGTGMGTGAGKRWQAFTLPPGKRSSYPALGPSSRSRPVSWRRSAHPLATSNTNGEDGDGDGDTEADENDDTLSMLSGTSTTRRARARHSYYPPGQSHHSQHLHPHPQQSPPYFAKSKPLQRLLPRTPGPHPLPSPGTASTDSIFLSGAGSLSPSPAGSVLVIGRGGAREPSIAEQSVNRAASVAATRASTGSMWSTFSYSAYPRPVHLPDLDVDLQGGGSGFGSGFGPGSGSAGLSAGKGGGGGGTGADADTNGEVRVPVGGRDFGEALALGGLTGVGVGKDAGARAPHPYSAAASAGASGAAEGGEEGGPEPEPARRRWNVHPLKRIAEMGRLRR